MNRPWMIFVSLTGTAIIGFAINQLFLLWKAGMYFVINIDLYVADKIEFVSYLS
ncbi:hypothetical protein [Alteribacillus bidgolensis]|uniref:Uncharacterized protein n=1 Tax=Alteribacillus bidgolensis TaxID=930129 RepID=A0A1G8QQ01_9BACI|nr:hypothetical protein [Alteribacillus bidgolensis]SDJ06869.1 hypothetical protein SAMN05216352_12134 [Alteribacillus bidgolensis]